MVSASSPANRVAADVEKLPQLLPQGGPIALPYEAARDAAGRQNVPPGIAT